LTINLLNESVQPATRLALTAESQC